MPEEIMFADMLNHYSIKINEISDLLNNVVANLNKSVSISQEAWQSDAADKFVLQVSNVQQYINRANTSLDELMRLFNTIKQNEVDSQFEELEANINASRNN